MGAERFDCESRGVAAGVFSDAFEAGFRVGESEDHDERRGPRESERRGPGRESRVVDVGAGRRVCAGRGEFRWRGC